MAHADAACANVASLILICEEFTHAAEWRAGCKDGAADSELAHWMCLLGRNLTFKLGRNARERGRLDAVTTQIRGAVEVFAGKEHSCLRPE